MTDAAAYDSPEGPSDADLRSVRDLAAEMIEAERVVAAAEAALATAQAALQTLKETKLPDAMLACGMLAFTLATGQQVRLETIYVGSIRDADRPAAYAWLRENGHADLLKRTLAVEFGMGEDNAAHVVRDKLADAMRDVGCSPDVEDVTTVHASTLKKFVRDEIRAKRQDRLPPSITVTTIRQAVVGDGKKGRRT